MGDAKSGNTMQTSNSNTNSTNTTGPNPFIVPDLQKIVGGATGWIANNMTMPGYFPGGTVAAPSAQSISANTGLAQRGAAQLGYGLNDASKRQLLDTISGKYLDPSTNPAFQDYLKASFQPQAEQFRDVLAPSIDSKFAGSGRTAGGAHFDTTMRGVMDLDRSQSEAAARAALGAYQGERSNQFGAMGLLPSFQAMDYQDLQAQAQAGQQADALRQRLKDDQNAKYSYDTSGQLDWYNRLAQSLLGMYPGGQTQGQSSTSGYSYGTGSAGGGGFGSIAGPIISGIGMALPFFSDARLKDIHARVGFTDEGLPLYLYQYKGEERPQIGPIAQDVERVMPDAVAEHPSGFKVVDYAALVPGGLF